MFILIQVYHHGMPPATSAYPPPPANQPGMYAPHSQNPMYAQNAPPPMNYYGPPNPGKFIRTMHYTYLQTNIINNISLSMEDIYTFF